MAVGELANFVAYAYAPAIIVTPLGALSVIVAAILAHYMLKERLNTFGALGCALCIVGSINIVMHAPPDQPFTSITQVCVCLPMHNSTPSARQPAPSTAPATTTTFRVCASPASSSWLCRQLHRDHRLVLHPYCSAEFAVHTAPCTTPQDHTSSSCKRHSLGSRQTQSVKVTRGPLLCLLTSLAASAECGSSQPCTHTTTPHLPSQDLCIVHATQSETAVTMSVYRCAWLLQPHLSSMAFVRCMQPCRVSTLTQSELYLPSR